MTSDPLAAPRPADDADEPGAGASAEAVGAEGDVAADADDTAAEPAGGGDGGDAPHVVRVGRTGRRVRLAVTALATVALLWGTFSGSDDHFPFGPFRMYANASRTDGVVRSARVEAVNAEGERFKLTDAATGLRRAEIEGQMDEFEADPGLLEEVADAYHARHPDRPRLLLVEILQRRYRLEDGTPTGRVTEHQIAAWTEDGHEELADYDARIAEEEAAEAGADDVRGGSRGSGGGGG